MADYYQTLGVKKDASKKEISDAYKKLAKKHHPDLNPGKGSENKIKEINEAYQILRDDAKRAQYDQVGHSNFKTGEQYGGQQSGFNSWQTYSTSGSQADFEDIFNLFGMDFTGSRKGQTRQTNSFARNGATLRYKTSISLEDAFFGIEKEIKFSCDVACTECNNTGSQSKKVSPCSSCQGHGVIIQRRGFFNIEMQCPTCFGKGYIIPDICIYCNGKSVVNKQKKIRINIPKGIKHESVINIPGKGESGLRGGTAGDLQVIILVEDHPSFYVEGANLHTNIDINYPTAVLGGKIFFNSIGGEKIELEIKKGTKNNSQIVVKSRGMPDKPKSETRGDLIIKIGIEVKGDITSEEKKLISQLKDLYQNENKSGDSFFSKVKNLW